MKNQHAIILLTLITVILSASIIACLPKRIDRQSSWATIQDSQWKLQWQDSIRTQEQRTFWDSKIDVDVTSRATAWYNETQQTGLLTLATPDIYIAGFAVNQFKTQSDEWVLREIAKQGGGVAQEKLGITFDPSTVPLTLQETVTVQTPFGTSMIGSRFLANTSQGDGYVTILRGVHEGDVIVFATAAQSLEASRATDNVATLLHHPSQEPTVAVTDWQALAEKWARYYQIDPRLLKAVVEAETTTNIAGDYDENRVPHAFGYGQVWPRWHYANIQKAILDTTGVPTNTTDEQALGKFILGDDDTSMAAAALVVRDMWRNIGSPVNLTDYSVYTNFTKKYVGPAISQNDLARRWQIWQKHLQ